MQEKTDKIEWHTEDIEIRKLNPFPKNPRQIHKDRLRGLKNLIDKYNIIDLPVINTDMTIIGGHQRIKILKSMKAKTIECRVPNRLLSDEDVEELCIGLNLHQGSFDYDILGDQWDLCDLLKYGFTEEQLMGCFEKKKAKDSEAKAKKSKVCPSCGHEF